MGGLTFSQTVDEFVLVALCYPDKPLLPLYNEFCKQLTDRGYSDPMGDGFYTAVRAAKAARAATGTVKGKLMGSIHPVVFRELRR